MGEHAFYIHLSYLLTGLVMLALLAGSWLRWKRERAVQHRLEQD